MHYNSRSIAPLRLAAARARRRSTRPTGASRPLLREPRFQLKLRLADGELVVFDNQRILHGRTAFSSARHARHLRGCYLTRDSVYSAAALLRRGSRTRGAMTVLEEILALYAGSAAPAPISAKRVA